MCLNITDMYFVNEYNHFWEIVKMYLFYYKMYRHCLPKCTFFYYRLIINFYAVHICWQYKLMSCNIYYAARIIHIGKFCVKKNASQNVSILGCIFINVNSSHPKKLWSTKLINYVCWMIQICISNNYFAVIMKYFA